MTSYNHVIWTLNLPTGEKYATDELVDNFQDYQPTAILPHAARQLVVDGPAKSWKATVKHDSRFDGYTLVSVPEMIRIHEEAYPQSPVKFLNRQDGDEDED